MRFGDRKTKMKGVRIVTPCIVRLDDNNMKANKVVWIDYHTSLGFVTEKKKMKGVRIVPPW